MPKLRMLDPGKTEGCHSLDRDVVSFGRSGDCDLVIEARGISRLHGRFVRDRNGRWWIEDLGSRNGILVNGHAASRHALADGDIIVVGEVTLAFCEDPAVTSQPAAPAVTITDALPSANTVLERSPGTVRSMDNRRLTSLYEITRRLLNQRDVAGLVEVAASALLADLEAEVVVVGLTRDPEREPDRVEVRPKAMQNTGVTLSRSVLRRAIDDQRALLVADTGSDRALLSAQSIAVGGIRSALCVPLMRRDDVSGFIYVDNRRLGRTYDERDLEFASAIGAVVGTAIENARLHETELVKQRMETELAAARRVQQAILPSSWVALDGWDIYGEHTTCREVGGDYYDAIVSEDGHLWLVMADVCGKGAPAALLASIVHAIVHAMVDQCSSPSQLLARLNRLLLRREMESSFVTCLVVRVAPTTGDVLLASGGHPWPLCISPAQPPRLLPVEGGIILGAFPDASFADVHWSLAEPGGALLMYTDGLTEALDAQGEQFGEDRLLRAASNGPSSNAQALVTTAMREVQAFRGGHYQSDDLTLLACRRIVSGNS
jgi:phosphoserine phosphatase RsbU/P